MALGIGTALAGIGIDFVKDLILDNGEELVKEGIKKVTGIDLSKKEVKDLAPEEIIKIKESELAIRNLDYEILKLTLDDRGNAREHNVKIQSAKDWLVRNVGSIIALLTIIYAFALDTYILYLAFEKGFIDGVLELNPIVTLVAGYSSARAIQVLSFYFGDSKVNADSKRSI